MEPFKSKSSTRKKTTDNMIPDHIIRALYAFAWVVITLYCVHRIRKINVPVSTKQGMIPVFWIYLLVHLLAIPFIHLDVISCLFAFALLFWFRLIQACLTGVVIVWIVGCISGSIISIAITFKMRDRRYFFSFIFFCFFIEWQQLHSLNASAWDNYRGFLSNLPSHFDVHEYWQLSRGKSLSHLDDFMFDRTKKIHDQYLATGRTDFQIEKSKCFMYDYFKRHNIPHVPVIGQWDSKEDFWSWIRSDKAEFPLIVKFCHLTQGTQAWKGFKEVHGNTFFLKNKESLDKELFQKWINAGWATVPEDPGRSWEENMREPLKALTPGLFVQPAWKFFPGMSQPLEMKVFVIWGKVFFMRFESGIADWGAGNARVDRFYVLPNVDLKIRDNTNALLKYGTGNIPMLSDIPNIEDHLRAVIKLAELDAQTLKADFFRVDIFLNPDDPNSPAINEHSLLEISNFMNENHKYATKLLHLGYGSSNLRMCSSASKEHVWTELECNAKK